MTEKEYFDKLLTLSTEVLDFIDNSNFREEWKNALRQSWDRFHYDSILYGNCFYTWEEKANKDEPE